MSEEDRRTITKTLRLMADNIDRLGLPKEVFIVNMPPEDDYGLFVCIWPSHSEDRRTKVVRPSLGDVLG